MRDDDTIAAIATAPGRGGIGVVRVSGPLVSRVIGGLLPHAIEARVATLSPFLDDAGQVLDEGIAIFFQRPHSYTGQDVLELHGHGGPIVLQRLLKRCLEMGARIAEPGEFTRRAYLNGKLDLVQAEAVIDLINASTEQAARCSVRALTGEYSNKIQGIASLVLNLRVVTEATLDFPEEDIEAVIGQRQGIQLGVIEHELDALLIAAKRGSLLAEGIHVVVAGQPNAGKSSLLNRLAGQDIAIVTEIPGTTRDLIRESITLDGIPMHIIDTAGLRETADPVERIGVERAWEAVSRADVVLVVIDGQKGETEADHAILKRLPPGIHTLRVMNKADLVSGEERQSQDRGAEIIWLSAKTGEGVDCLREALKKVVGWDGRPEGVFMAHTRHLEAMYQSLAHLRRARTEISKPELFAEELRLAHEALMGIVGQVTPDDLLGQIFSRFCIGK